MSLRNVDNDAEDRLYLFGGGNLTYYDTTHAHHDLNDAMQKTMEVLRLL
jgi:hypothetical protein